MPKGIIDHEKQLDALAYYLAEGWPAMEHLAKNEGWPSKPRRIYGLAQSGASYLQRLLSQPK